MSWRALDAYNGDHGKVGKGNPVCILVMMTGTWGLVYELPCQLLKVGMRNLVHTWLVGETVGDVDLEAGILPMGLVSLGKGSQCSLVFLP